MGKEPDQIGDDTARIRADIEQTRAEMGETIDALQEKLSPDRIKAQVRDKANEAYRQAKDSVKRATIGKAEVAMSKMTRRVGDATRGARHAVEDTGVSVLETIRHNPIPFGLIGLGVGMLALSRSRDHREEYAEDNNRAVPYGDPQYTDFEYDERLESQGASMSGRAREVAGEAAGRVKEAAGNAAGRVRETASRVAAGTRERASRLGAQTRERARQAGHRAEDMMYGNPLAVGVAALAAGAAVGLAIPSTRHEREYLGEARDRVVGQVKGAARDTVDKVKKVAEEAGRSARREAENQGLTG